MIATVTPLSIYYNENMNTLKYAQGAKKIVNTVRINSIDTSVALNSVVSSHNGYGSNSNGKDSPRTEMIKLDLKTEFKNEMQNYNKQIEERLAEHVAKLKQEQVSQSEQLQNYEKQLEEYRKKHTHYKEELQSYQEELQSYEKELQNYQKEQHQQQKELQNYQKDIDECEKELENHNYKISAVRDEHMREMENLRNNHKTEIDKLYIEQDKLTKYINALNKKHESLLRKMYHYISQLDVMGEN
jgi:chromosome segregation ATPase